MKYDQKSKFQMIDFLMNIITEPIPSWITNKIMVSMVSHVTTVNLHLW